MTIKQPLALCLIAGLPFSLAQSGPETIVADFVFENVHVIPMDSERVEEDRTLAVRDGRIVAIVDASAAGRIRAATRIDGQGRFLMPGLADMHVHVRWDPQSMFDLFIAHGVTTVANMYIKDGGGRINHTELRSEVARGERIGPRYLLSGDHYEDDFPSSTEEAAAVLAEQVERGYDFVKIHGNLAPDVYDALIKGARAKGLRITGHAQRFRPLDETLRMDALEHAEELLYASTDPAFGAALQEDFLSVYRAHASRLRNPAYRAPIIEKIAQSSIYVDPTLIVYKMVGEWASTSRLAAMQSDPQAAFLPPRVKIRWFGPQNPYQEEGFPLTPSEVAQNLDTLFLLVNELNDAGVPLLLGTDTFGTLVPGYSLHQELELLVEAGLSPYEAMKAGTTNVAAYLGEADHAGLIRPDYRADFILLDENPLADIRNSQSVSGVYTGKRWLSRADLERLKQAAKRKAQDIQN